MICTNKYLSILVFTFLLTSSGVLHSQNKPLHYIVESTASLSSEDILPFWMSANKLGRLPESNSGQLNIGIYSEFTDNYEYLDVAYGGSLNGFIAETSEFFIDELYVSFRSDKLQLDVGIKHPEQHFNGLSSSNGNIVMSGNARSFPGINLKLAEFVDLPLFGNRVGVKGSFGEYLLNDPRVVDNARLHAKSLLFRSKLSYNLNLITGIYHYAQWGGTSDTYGKQPTGLDNYLKIVLGSEGGGDASRNDQLNVLGNHVGSYIIQLDYENRDYSWNVYYSHPIEDKSGVLMRNYPDALYGINIDFKNSNGLLTQLLLECTYTKHMSGSSPNYTDALGNVVLTEGRDNYFNNLVYGSGWTYFGRTIGSPFFTEAEKDLNGITRGVIYGDNRFLALNLGLRGNLSNIGYKTMLSHTTFYGPFEAEYIDKPQQFSGLAEFIFKEPLSLPVNFIFGLAFDTGTYNGDNFGGFIKLSTNGIF